MASNLQRFFLKKDEHTYWTLPVDGATTAGDVLLQLASKLEIKPSSCLLLEARTEKGVLWGLFYYLYLLFIFIVVNFI